MIPVGWFSLGKIGGPIKSINTSLHSGLYGIHPALQILQAYVMKFFEHITANNLQEQMERLAKETC